MAESGNGWHVYAPYKKDSFYMKIVHEVEVTGSVA